MSLQHHKANWDRLGGLDPLWAILADPSKQHGKWDVDEFFATGEAHIAQFLTKARALGYPQRWDRALDFGCGVGRLTRALRKHFHECQGVDISDSMIAKARELNAAFGNCRFNVNDAEDLRMFPDAHFDLIVTWLVLQHVPDQTVIKSYIAEFSRLLRPGGLLAFQLPHHLSLRSRIQPRRRLYSVLHAFGLPDSLLYDKLGLTPMVMNWVPEAEVRTLLAAKGLKLLQVEVGTAETMDSRTYYAAKTA